MLGFFCTELCAGPDRHRGKRGRICEPVGRSQGNSKLIGAAQGWFVKAPFVVKKRTWNLQWDLGLPLRAGRDWPCVPGQVASPGLGCRSCKWGQQWPLLHGAARSLKCCVFSKPKVHLTRVRCAVRENSSFSFKVFIICWKKEKFLCRPVFRFPT